MPDRSSHISVINPTPYSFILTKSEVISGYWDKSPNKVVEVFDKDSPYLKDKFGFYGSEAILAYDIVLGNPKIANYQKKLASFEFHFEDANVSSNQLIVSSNTSGLDVLDDKKKVIGTFNNWYIRSLVGDGNCPPHGKWLYNRIESSGSPICIEVGLITPSFTAAEFMKKLPGILGGYKFVLLSIKGDYDTPSSFDSALAIHNFDKKYNCVAWSIGDTTSWYNEPLIDTDSAINFYKGLSYKLIPSCDFSQYDIALYCNIDSSNNCITHGAGTPYQYVYTHVARAISNQDVVGQLWSSKFGMGPILSHFNPKTIGGTNKDYGVPRLCFAKASTNDVEIKSLTTDNLSFSQDEYAIINKLVNQIPQEARDKFEINYQAWQDFCNQPKIVISSITYSRAQGDEFEKLVHEGKTHPNEVIPLLVEKLMHEDQYIAHVIFEAITGVYNNSNNNLFVSSQRKAFDLADNWLKANGNSDSNISIHNLELEIDQLDSQMNKLELYINSLGLDGNDICYNDL